MPDAATTTANADAKTADTATATILGGAAEVSKDAAAAAGGATAAGATEVAAAGKDAAGKDGKAAETAAATTTPEPITFTLPKGVELDPAASKQFTEIAQAVGLKSDGAQKVVDLYVGLQQKAQEKYVADVLAERQGWEKSLREDKDIGGEHWDASLKDAKRALTKFGSPELLKTLNETGLGSHPEVVRAFVRIGKELAEDSLGGVSGDGGGAKKDLADLLFTHPTSQKFRSSRG